MRYFQLKRDTGELKILKDTDSPTKCKEPIEILFCSDGSFSGVTKDFPYSFRLSTSSKEMNLYAKTKEEMNMWVNELQ